MHPLDILRVATIIVGGLVIGMSGELIRIYARTRRIAPKLPGITVRHVIYGTVVLGAYIVSGMVEVGVRVGNPHFNPTTPLYLLLEVVTAYWLYELTRYERSRLNTILWTQSQQSKT